MMLALLAVVAAVLVALSQATATATTWRMRAYQAANPAQPTQSDFPEVPYLKDRPNTAIGFTGGGARAYVAALGEIAALHKLDLIKNVRYIAGISGGSWATLTYSYAGNGASDDVLLGDVVMPHDITLDKLKEMDPKCARGFPTEALAAVALKAIKDGVVEHFSDSWAYAIQKVYLDPAGIPAGTPFTWNAETLADIYQRNPTLVDNVKFILPTNAQRPFPIVGTTLVGPSDYAPYEPRNQNFTRIEITPMYVGQFRGQGVSYKKLACLFHCEHTVEVGGAIESFAFTHDNEMTASKLGMSSSSTSDILSIPAVTNPLDVQFAAASSSYAPGAFFESMITEKLDVKFGMEFNYWSPSAKVPEVKKNLFTDGGCYENIPLMSFLQRRVEKIVLFFNAETPLQPSSAWDVAANSAYDNQVTDTLSMYFGIWESKERRYLNRSYEIENNQVFATSDYVPVIQGLQAAQAKGNGIVYTHKLTTIENTWWGIPAGLTAEVTFVYLGRLPTWENRLTLEMKEVLVPQGDDAANLAVDIKHGPFREFPHYATTGGFLNHERANALADLTGWSVLQNADMFKKIFS